MSTSSRALGVAAAVTLAGAGLAAPAQAATAPSPIIRFTVTGCQEFSMAIRPMPTKHTYVFESNRIGAISGIGESSTRFVGSPGLYTWRLRDHTAGTYVEHGSFTVARCPGGALGRGAYPGDEDGDGRADILAVHQDGRLLQYRSTGSGLTSPTQIGTGWSSFHFVSRLPAHAERMSDLVAVANDGTAWSYTHSYGRYTWPKKAGTGLSGYRDFSVLSENDPTSLGHAVFAGRSGSTETRWPMPLGDLAWPTKRPASPAARVVRLDDVSGDGWADDVEIGSDGRMTLVLKAWDESTRRVRLGSGWGAMTALTSPGDLTGDGLSDLVARRSDGRLFLYAGTAKGVNGAPGFAPARQIGNGWNAIKIIF